MLLLFYSRILSISGFFVIQEPNELNRKTKTNLCGARLCLLVVLRKPNAHQSITGCDEELHAVCFGKGGIVPRIRPTPIASKLIPKIKMATRLGLGAFVGGIGGYVSVCSPPRAVVRVGDRA